MSEESDKESKTELPTDKRRQDAIDRGNVPASMEAHHLAFLLSLVLVADHLLASATTPIVGSLTLLLEHPHQFRLETVADVALLLRTLSVEIVPFIVLLLLPFLILGIGVSALQSPLKLAYERIKPDPSRLSVRQGWKRIAGISGLLLLAKGLLKLSLVGVIGVSFVANAGDGLLPLLAAPAILLPIELTAAVSKVAWSACIAIVLLAIADTLASRMMWERSLKMTRQEVRDEMRQMEGDPLVNARRLSIARRRSRKRMLGSVPRATLVVANPTHYAVALRYVKGEGGAPRVVAKGQDLVALQIRKIAESHGIPVAEDKALARSLYKAVEVNQSIPPEFYRAVADVIILLRKRGSQRIEQALMG